MIISENWLRELVTTNLSAQEIADTLTLAGLEVDAVESLAGALDGVVVGQIVEKEKHPDADKLNLTKVDIGTGENLTIVCGASNVEVGMKVPVATIGCKLPNGLKIKKSKIRGQQSFGMLCSEQELGLADSADGLLELAEDAPLGQLVEEYLGLDDTIIDIDLTPNRGDCLSLTGIARELHVLVGAEYSPMKITEQPTISSTKVGVKIENYEACASYLGRVIEGVNAQAPTPDWMKNRLKRCGVNTVSVIVDITNYVMLELGQPMHAFDKQKIQGDIVVRAANDDEKIALLNDDTVELMAGTLVIADSQKPLAIAGVMGGTESAINDATTDIILESAHFTKKGVAGTARSYGLHTDSSHRFERGVDPLLPEKAMQRATELIQEICGGAAGEIVVSQKDGFSDKAPVNVRFERVRRVLGMPMESDEVAAILSRIADKVEKTDEGWLVTPPSYRFDIERECDLVEEVARVKGYDNLDDCIPRLVLSGRVEPEAMLDNRKLLNTMVSLGYQEAISYSFVDEQIRADFAAEQQEPIRLANPLAENMSVMRNSLWPGLVTACQFNLNRQNERIRLFEVGAVFQVDENIYERDKISGLVCGRLMPLQWHTNQDKLVDFYDVKADLEAIFSLTGDAMEFIVAKSCHPALHPGQSGDVFRGDDKVGCFGKIHPNLAKKYDLPVDLFLFELDLTLLRSGKIPTYTSVSKFPSVNRDLALMTPIDVSAGKVISAIYALDCKNLRDVQLFDVYSGEGVANNKKSLAIKLTYQHLERTLQDDEVESQTKRILEELNKKMGIELR